MATPGWMNKWKQQMAWVYMAVCVFDFVIAPVWWTYVQLREPELMQFRQWMPLTLQGAGLFHMAMGAVLGITAYVKPNDDQNKE